VSGPWPFGAAFARLLDALPAMVWMAGPDGGCAGVNAAWLSFTGQGSDEVRGRGWMDPIHPEDLAEVEEACGRAFAAAGPFEVEFRLRHASGSWRWFSCGARPLFGEFGACEGYLGSAADISEIRLAQGELVAERSVMAARMDARTEELITANEQLLRANRLKDEFLANMSHELRTPLSAILGLAEALRQGVYGDVTERQALQIATIEDSGRQLLAVVSDILDLSRIEAGAVQLEIAELPVNLVCQSAIRQIRTEADRRLQTVLYTEDMAVGTVFADQRHLRHMLGALLGNAVRYTPEGGTIGLEVRGDPDGRYVRFTVWDTGIGIAEADLERIFRPFVLLDTSLSRRHSGGGLGLTLVERLARLHGGGVRVESEPGNGSRFTVVLPWKFHERIAGAAADASPAAQRPSEPPSAPGQPLILLAEDNETLVTLLTEYLETVGYRVVTATTGGDAVEIARAMRPALVLMDIQLPVMDGLEAIRRLRARSETQGTPVFAITAHAMPGDAERCIGAGADACFTKPVSLESLARAIEQRLHGPASPA